MTTNVNENSNVSNNNKVYNVNMFIIPSKGFKVGKFPLNIIAESTRRRVKLYLGIDVSDDDTMVQIWTHSKECDNWADHSDCPIMQGRNFFPNYLPKRLFEGKKEGDVIELTTPYGKIIATLKQRGFRYEMLGNFEDAIEKVS